MGREEAHALIKKYAVQNALGMREGTEQHRLVEDLGADPMFPLSTGEIRELLADQSRFLGNAKRQIRQVEQRVKNFIVHYEDAEKYEPGEIL